MQLQLATRKETFCLTTSPGSSCKLRSDHSYSEVIHSLCFPSPTDHGLVLSQSAQGESCFVHTGLQLCAHRVLRCNAIFLLSVHFRVLSSHLNRFVRACLNPVTRSLVAITFHVQLLRSLRIAPCTMPCSPVAINAATDVGQLNCSILMIVASECCGEAKCMHVAIQLETAFALGRAFN